jgi:hypothetical protein
MSQLQYFSVGFALVLLKFAIDASESWGPEWHRPLSVEKDAFEPEARRQRQAFVERVLASEDDVVAASESSSVVTR